jgi:hypothetical protein
VGDVLRSSYAHAPESKSRGVPAWVTKTLVPYSSVSKCGASTCFVSKEGSELIGKGLKMKKVVVHAEDEVSMWVIGS